MNNPNPINPPPPINKNHTARMLREEVAKLAPPLRAHLPNMAKLKFIFFDWFLRLGKTNIVINNAHVDTMPGDWNDGNAQSYTVEFSGRSLYLFLAEFRLNVMIIWLQDTILRECFEARPFFAERIPQLSGLPTAAEIENEDVMTTDITAEFTSFFYPFLSSVAAGKKPHRKPFGSSSCSSVNSR